MKVIQMIIIGNNSIFLTNFDLKTNQLEFRTSFEPNYLQKEEISIDKNGVIYTNLYHFHKSYLDKFMIENNIN